MIKKITANELRVGMYICDTNRKWIDLPFLRQKFLIKTQDELSSLLEYCEYFFIDTHKGLDVVTIAECNEPDFSVTSPPEELASDKHLINNPYLETYIHCIDELERFFAQAKHQPPLDTSMVHTITQQLMTGVMESRDNMIALCQTPMRHDELARKSVNVCILACALGWHLGLSTAELFALGLGALLHDIGIIRIPDNILSKVDPLTQEERTAVEKHVEYGLALLIAAPDIPKQILKMVYHHHERFDGKGYPKGLKGDENGLLVQIVSLSSVYEALTRDRADRKSLTPESALQFIYQSGDTLFDPALVERFIELLGIYPSGCIVELSGGELALISRVNPTAPLRPQIVLLTDPQKNLLDNKVMIDLTSEDQAHRSIIGTLASDEPALTFLQLLHQSTV
jgi:HD-GYP domain-containing protein (c-di-GMP phosphodiesterase class II)